MAWVATILARIFMGFPQFLKENSGGISQLGHAVFIPNRTVQPYLFRASDSIEKSYPTNMCVSLRCFVSCILHFWLCDLYQFWAIAGKNLLGMLQDMYVHRLTENTKTTYISMAGAPVRVVPRPYVPRLRSDWLICPLRVTPLATDVWFGNLKGKEKCIIIILH
jgi:hypothetical protein